MLHSLSHLYIVKIFLDKASQTKKHVLNYVEKYHLNLKKTYSSCTSVSQKYRYLRGRYNLLKMYLLTGVKMYN